MNIASKNPLPVRFAFALTIVLLIAGTGLSQDREPVDESRFHPYLKSILDQKTQNEFVAGYVMMKDRLTYSDVMQRVNQAGLGGGDKKTRRSFIKNILKDHASVSQGVVMSYLQSQIDGGNAREVRSLWINNVVAFQAKPDVFYGLSAIDQVGMLHFDAEYPANLAMDAGPEPVLARETTLRNLALIDKSAWVPAPAFADTNPGVLLIRADQVWAQFGAFGDGVIVANVDSGTDYNHPDLVNRIWINQGEIPGDGIDNDNNGYIDDIFGWDFGGGDNDPMDESGHGTSTAGLVVGDGTSGTQTGVAPGADLMILRIDGAGETGVWAAYQYAVDNGADVITSSFSFKWYFDPQPNYPMFRQITDMELAMDVIHTNSTSNDGSGVGVPFNIATPGDCPAPWIHPDQTLKGQISAVLGVANVNALTDIIEGSSPHGPTSWEDFQIFHPNYPYVMPPQYQDYPYETIPGAIGLIKPDVAAPGNGTRSTNLGGGYTNFSGTSGATPHVGGLSALLLSMDPGLRPIQLAQAIMVRSVEKGDPGKDNRYGVGRIDAYAAASLVAAGDLIPNPPSGFEVYSDYTTPDSAFLTWTDPEFLFNGDSLLNFEIEISRDGLFLTTLPSGVGAYSDGGLNDGQSYEYTLMTKNLNSDSLSWIGSSVSVYTGGAPVPNPPADFFITRTAELDLKIHWNNPATNVDGTPMDDLAGVNLYEDSVLVATYVRSPSDTGRADSAVFAAGAGLFTYHLTAFDNEPAINTSAFSDPAYAPLVLPVFDPFAAAGIPVPALWNSSTTEVSDKSVNPPSPDFALALDSNPNGPEAVTSKPINLTGLEDSSMAVSFHYQPEGQGNKPESDDSLYAEIRNSAGDWIRVREYPGTAEHPFVHEVIFLDSVDAGAGETFFHNEFAVRFGVTSNPPSGASLKDVWFIDDLFVGKSTNVPVGIAASGSSEIPKKFKLYSNYPNPFNPSTRIRYDLPFDTKVSLRIYNLLGQAVRTLVHESQRAGSQVVIWDGKNDFGHSVSSGIYFYRIQASQFVKSRKMMFLK